MNRWKVWLTSLLMCCLTSFVGSVIAFAAIIPLPVTENLAGQLIGSMVLGSISSIVISILTLRDTVISWHYGILARSCYVGAFSLVIWCAFLLFAINNAQF